MIRATIDRLFLAAQEGAFQKSFLLQPLSWLWGKVVRSKNALYDQGWLTSKRVPAVVVSVGSLTAGGSGKTPLVDLLARELMELAPVAILSRGYRADPRQLPLGDEMQMLKNRLPSVRIYVGKNRTALAHKAVKEGAKILLLDDGLQHRRLARDFELISLHDANPFGYREFLPRGLLRDDPKRLESADLVLTHGGKQTPSFSQVRLNTRVRRFCDLSQTAVSLPLNTPCSIFCAIAYPKRFRETLTSLGFSIQKELFLADHRRIDLKTLSAFAQESKESGSKVLFCTEKDAVKLTSLPLSLPLYYLEIEAFVSDGQEAWDSLIEKIALKVNNASTS